VAVCLAARIDFQGTDYKSLIAEEKVVRDGGSPEEGFLGAWRSLGEWMELRDHRSECSEESLLASSYL
jgi:hypothetical protein